jgi:hypothetical protein
MLPHTASTGVVGRICCEFEALKNGASLIIEKQLRVSLELPNPVARADAAVRSANQGAA